jgi:hypothetical protein
MVTTRKYRSPQAYFRGGAVPGDDADSESGKEAARADAPPSPPPHDDDAVMHAAEAQRRAEELQRAHVAQQHQAAQKPPDPERLISGLPGPAQAWLRAHPEFVGDPKQNAELQAVHSYLVGRKGVPQFSDEYFRALDNEFGFDAPPRSEPPPSPAIPSYVSGSPEPSQAAHIAPAMTAPPPPAPPRRSMPLSAPVARDVPSLGGQRVSGRQIILTPEERMIARNSFTDPTLTNEQKELLYAQNKARYQQMLSDGSYSDARHQR